MLELNKIYCMDCINGLKEIDSESIDVIITDPPYNTGMKYKVRFDKNSKLQSKKPWLFGFFNDDYSKKDYRLLVKNSCKEFYRTLKNNKPIYIFINFKSYNIWYNNLLRSNFKIKNVIIWDKVIHGLNYQNYAYTYEMIIYATKGDFRINKDKKYYKDVWNIKRKLNNTSNKFHHETEKPFNLIKIIVNQSSKEGDIVLDAFMGGGISS